MFVSHWIIHINNCQIYIILLQPMAYDIHYYEITSIGIVQYCIQIVNTAYKPGSRLPDSREAMELAMVAVFIMVTRTTIVVVAIVVRVMEAIAVMKVTTAMEVTTAMVVTTM